MSARTRWLLLGGFVLLAGLVSLMMGAYWVGPGALWDGLLGGPDASTAGEVVHVTRLPRLALGFLVGAALSVAGVLFQALLRNELAEPYLLGVGPGALLGVTVAAVIAGDVVAPPMLSRGVLAFAGAVGVAILVFSFARRAGRRPAVTVLLAGVAVGATVHAIASGMLYMQRDWHATVRWLLGDLNLAGWDQVLVLAPVAVVGTLGAWLFARDLDVLTLGETSAWYAGVAVRRALWLFGGLGCLLAAATVAQCGLVGFVGLVVPHLGRRLLGTGHRTLIPAAALLGGGLLVLADGFARTLLAPRELPLAVVTAALGAPVLAALVLRRGNA